MEFIFPCFNYPINIFGELTYLFQSLYYLYIQFVLILKFFYILKRWHLVNPPLLCDSVVYL